jgi:SAM-dependent methyltransferase
MEKDSEPTRYIAELYHSPKFRPRLIELLYRFLRHSRFNQKDITNLLRQKINSRQSSDAEFMVVFAKLIKTPDSDDTAVLEKRAANRLAEVVKLFEREKEAIRLNPAKGDYLDIGAAECRITKVLGEGLGYSIENIYAIDTEDYSKVCAAVSPRLTFLQIDGKEIPFPDAQFNFITCFQVLHHMTHLEAMLSELVRVMRPGGILLIREQDSGAPEEREIHKKLFDVEHMLYDIAMKKIASYSEFMASYYSYFRNKKEWTDLLGEYGFRLLKIGHITKFNPTSNYYAVYELSSSSNHSGPPSSSEHTG